MNSRRTFLAGMGTAMLAPHVVPALPSGDDGRYVVGTMSNRALSGAWADRVLKTWVAVAADRTGFGVLTDRYDPAFSSHLAVQSAARNGGGYRWQGIIIRSNDPRLLRQPFVLTATADDGAASLEIALLGLSLRGPGLIVG